MKSREERLGVLNSARLYAILDSGYLGDHASYQAKADLLLKAGVRVFQLRLKGASCERVGELCCLLAPRIQGAGGILILNDYVDWACELPVDGVHVGQDDLSVSEARERIGGEAVVGLSTHSLDQVRGAVAAQPDYIGFGPLFATGTKPDYVPIGLQDIREATRIVSPLPVFCIGGINLERLPMVLESGAERVVIVSALLLSDASDMYAEAVFRCMAGFKDYGRH
jgi:thiamine-phosphate pyrophosphorylase